MSHKVRACLLLLAMITGPAFAERSKSAAMARHVVDDSENEFWTRFTYQPVKGLGYEEGTNRRDPSTILKVDDLYYVWYTHNHDPKSKWLNADLWYATSPDGIHWTEKGPAVERGPAGAWDDYSVFTCDILVANKKYYLTYQAEGMPQRTRGLNVVGMAVADTPDGPWTKLPEPILRTTEDGTFETKDDRPPWDYRLIKRGSWDSWAVHDPGVIPRWGKYWLYYKGHGIGDTMWADSKWGVAVADRPEGPYVKSAFNPVTNSGHETWVWPYRNGIAAMVDWAGPEKGTIQFTEDGINFTVVATLEDIPPAGGAYVPDKFDDPENGQGFTWGLAHYGRSDWNFLVRFECDLKQGVKKRTGWDYFPHYSTIRDVLQNPDRFGVPREALYRKAKRPED